jgi:catalase
MTLAVDVIKKVVFYHHQAVLRPFPYMKNPNIQPSDRRFKSKIPKKQARLIGFLFALPVVFILFYKASSAIGSNSVSAQQFVDLQQGPSVHAGFRRAHAKGICITGVFASNGALSDYSRSDVLQSGRHPFIGRFSTAGNNPTAPDLGSPVRSLALILSSQDSDDLDAQWRMAMNTPPVMAVATPEAFYEQLLALAPDPETQQRVPAKIQAFFDAHPESKAFLQWRDSYEPTNSFASEQYHSINAFYLVDDEGEKQAVRWKAVPTKASGDIPPLDKASPDALQEQLLQILKAAPVEFDLVFTLAAQQDDHNNPTIPWPADRKSLNAGTLIVQSASSEEDGQCANRSFDPLVLPEGVRPTADPILNARSAAYAESFRRRAKEVLLGTDE